MRYALLPLIAAAALAGCAANPPAATGAAPAMLRDGVLADAKGMTLYTFDRDAAGTGRSVCNADCARNWPPFYAPSGVTSSGEFFVIRRDDGRGQWAFKGKPLYYWPEDQEPGDKFGDGQNNLWRVVGPGGPVTVAPAANADGY